MLLKARSLDYIFTADSMGLSSTTDTSGFQSCRIWQLTQNNGNYVGQSFKVTDFGTHHKTIIMRLPNID